MPTEGHLNHRFCVNCLEAAEGVVVRVVVLGKNWSGWCKRKAKLFFSPPRCTFFNTQIATSLSACRFGYPGSNPRNETPKKDWQKKAGQLIW
jgi:hypothetical protein